MSPRRRLSTICAGLALVAAFACGGKKSVDHDKLLREMTAVRTEACACKDKACAQAADEKMHELTHGLVIEDFSDQEKKAMAEAAGCVTKLGIP